MPLAAYKIEFHKVFAKFFTRLSEAYLKPSRTSKMELSQTVLEDERRKGEEFIL